jgi:sugar O-acyltransferase (sialic acid O-acetyltransferase NeuD family)
MIDTQNKKSITIIGYKQSTMAQEFAWWIGQEFKNVSIVEPLDLVLCQDTSYIISLTKDKIEKASVIKQLQNMTFAKFVHESVVIHGSSKVGYGTFIGPNVSLFFNSVIGDHCIIGPYCMISHACEIRNNNIVHPGTIIAGSVKIGSDCVFGMRTTIIDKLTICDNVFVGAGSLVTKNIDVPGRYIGSPARKTK